MTLKEISPWKFSAYATVPSCCLWRKNACTCSWFAESFTLSLSSQLVEQNRCYSLHGFTCFLKIVVSQHQFCKKIPEPDWPYNTKKVLEIWGVETQTSTKGYFDLPETTAPSLVDAQTKEYFWSWVFWLPCRFSEPKNALRFKNFSLFFLHVTLISRLTALTLAGTALIDSHATAVAQHRFVNLFGRGGAVPCANCFGVWAATKAISDTLRYRMNKNKPVLGFAEKLPAVWGGNVSCWARFYCGSLG